MFARALRRTGLGPIHAAIALSLAMHAAALFLRLPSFLDQRELEPPQFNLNDRLDIRLVPEASLPSAPSAPAFAPRAAPEPRSEPLMAAPGTPDRPRLTRPGASSEARAAKGEPPAAVEPPAPPTPPAPRQLDAQSLRDQVVSAYLGAGRDRASAGDVARGGYFQVRWVQRDQAEFFYAGWSERLGRNVVQFYPVERGLEDNVRIALVRKVVAVIREQWNGEFEWASKRLNRNVMLSARQQDTAELEEFLMREFFIGDQPARWGQAR